MILIIVSVLPVILLMTYFYYRDKFEKEPLNVLMKAFTAGAFSAVPAVVFALIMMSLFPLTGKESAVYQSFIKSFAEAAIPEEISKFALLYIFIWNDKNFNERYDGILYAVFVALGFAFVENIIYVFQNGVAVGISRALLAVPLHALAGVIMGYYFALAKFIVPKRASFLIKSVFFAIIAHGVYDFIIFYTDSMAGISPVFAGMGFLLIFVFIFYLWRFSLRKVQLHLNNSVFKNRNEREDEEV